MNGTKATKKEEKKLQPDCNDDSSWHGQSPQGREAMARMHSSWENGGKEWHGGSGVKQQ